MKQSDLSFAECDGDWQSIPRWVNFSIRFGYHWSESESGGRRIALVSMPSASSAAGLIALGAMIRDLGKVDADDITTHTNSLFDYARQYLDYCKNCDLKRCDPMIRGCGFHSESHGVFRSIFRKNNIYIVSEETDLTEKKLVVFERRNPGIKIEFEPEYVKNLYYDGRPPAMSSSSETGLQKSVYEGLIEEAEIYSENLRMSYSGLVLAGRAKGRSDTRTAYESLFFCNETESFTLAEMLGIHGWSESEISRTAFFNTRTEESDRVLDQPKLVVADGDSSFLKAIDTFKKSDIIGVIDRSLEREKLELVGQKFADLKTWYRSDTEFLGNLPASVPGISIAILKKQ